MLKKIISNLILFLITLTPFFGIVEVSTFLGLPLSANLLYVKLPKDILIILIAFLCTIYILNKGYPKKLYFTLFLLFIFTILVFVLSLNSLQIAIAGLRWIMPVFLIFLLYNIVDRRLLGNISNILCLLITLNVFLQIYEVFYMPPIWGQNFLGYSGRVPGFFSLSSPAGIFAAFCYFIIKYFYKYKYKNIFLSISVFSIILSMSSMGMGLFLLLISIPFYIKSRYKGIAIFFVIFSLVLGISNLDTLTGRNEGSTLLSGTTRLRILKEQMEDGKIISTTFGKATNTATNFRERLELYNDSFISDSIYISVLTNYGYLFFIIFLLYIFFVWIRVIKIGNLPMILFVVITLTAGLTTIITELFPTNILISVFAAYYLKYTS